jgi:hypothetical protein
MSGHFLNEINAEEEKDLMDNYNKTPSSYIVQKILDYNNSFHKEPGATGPANFWDTHKFNKKTNEISEVKENKTPEEDISDFLNYAKKNLQFEYKFDRGGKRRQKKTKKVKRKQRKSKKSRKSRRK